MAQNQYPLIFIKNANQNYNYTSPQTRGGEPSLPRRNRIPHGQKILSQLEEKWKEFQTLKTDREAISLSYRDGQYLDFKSGQGFELITKSLEHISKGIRLCNVKEVVENEKKVMIATVTFPLERKVILLKK